MTGTSGLGLRVLSLVLVSTPWLPLGRLQIADVYGSLQLCLGDRNYISSVSFSILKPLVFSSPRSWPRKIVVCNENEGVMGSSRVLVA